MSYCAKRAVMVHAAMPDSAGLLAEMLQALKDANISLLACTAWVENGQAMFLAVPEDPAKLRQLAMQNQVSTRETPAIVVQGDDAPGALLPAAKAVAAAGVALTTVIAAAGDGKFGAVLVPREADYEKACAALGC